MRFGRSLGRVAAGLVVAVGAVVFASPARAESDPPAPGPAPTLTTGVQVVPDDLEPVLESPRRADDGQAALVTAIAAERAKAPVQAVDWIDDESPAAKKQSAAPVISPPIRSSARPAASAGADPARSAGATRSSGQYHRRSGQYHPPRQRSAGPDRPVHGPRLSRPSHHTSIGRAIGAVKQLEKSTRICPEKLASCVLVCPENLPANDTEIDVHIAYCPGGGESPESPSDPGTAAPTPSALPAGGATCGPGTGESGAPNLPGDPVDTGTPGDTADSDGDITAEPCGDEPGQPTSSAGSPEPGAPPPDVAPTPAASVAAQPSSSPPPAQARTQISVEVRAGKPATPVPVAVAPRSSSNDAAAARAVVRHSPARIARPAARRAPRLNLPHRRDSAGAGRTGAIVRSAARSGTSDDLARRWLLMFAGLVVLTLLLATASAASSSGAGLVAIRSRLGSKGLSSRRIVLGHRLPEEPGRGSAEIRYRE